MKHQSRTKNSILNSASAVFTRGLSTLLQFVIRYVFIHFFIKEYLGVNGLFTNILTMLSLAELGIGDALIYSMYKPLAENNHKKLYSLMALYAKTYRFIALTVAVIGAALIPFLDFLIKDKPDDAFLQNNLVLVYLLFVFNTVVSYLFAYKRSILVADQKLYVANNYTAIGNICKSVLQIVAIIFHQYIVYLLLQILFTFLINVAISNKANRTYPFINSKEFTGEKLDSYEKNKIFSNIKALTLYKIGSVSLDFSDNIIISAIFGLGSVANLDNYVLITNSIQTLLFQIANSLTASIGNVVATESDEKQYSIFKTVNLINILLYGFCAICVFVLINPFIVLWAGKDWVFPLYTTAIITVNFFILGTMNSVWSYRSTMGLFVHGKFRPLVSAIVNIVISIILGKWMMSNWGIVGGVTGVLLGTTVTRVTTNVWFDPYIVFKYGFKQSVIPYYVDYIKNFLKVAIIAGITYFIVSLIPGASILMFAVKAVVTALLTALLLVVAYFRTNEFKYIVAQFKKVALRKKA